MSLKKFKSNDIVLNTMKTHPQCEFFIFDGRIFYNDTPEQSGSFSSNILNTSGGTGHISLYEYNIDRTSGQGTFSDGNSNVAGSMIGNHFIYPFITKDSARSSFRTTAASSSNSETVENEWTSADAGDTLLGKYPLSSSIIRELMTTAGNRRTDINTGSGETWLASPTYPHYWSLRNKLNFYGARSKHYKVTGSWTGTGHLEDPLSLPAGTTFEWIKDQQTINLISIPSIFYGSRIKPGSVSLKWYFTGSLAGELKDSKYNGELIQFSGSDNTSNDGKVAGVVMYEEGFIMLTGSWAINGDGMPLTSSGNSSPAWIYFGAGANDGVTQGSTGTNFNKASFKLTFKGTTSTQVMTMFANARRGEVNYSNNPTFIQYGQDQLRLTSSQVYEENPDRVIASVKSSSYTDYSASFKRQVYVSRVAIYDESKNLIGIATLANPVLKEEDQDLTFKIRLDI
jgi:hypothetical protein